MSLPTTHNLLARFPNPLYVETGIWQGDSLECALRAGFENIIGIDVSPGCIEFCVSRFDLNNSRDFSKRMTLIQGDSAECLYDAISYYEGPATFFLDSHWQMLEGTEKGENPFPLLRELDQIVRWTRKNIMANKPTIIIDDWLIMQEDIVGYNKIAIIQRIDECFIDRRGWNRELVANPVINGIFIATPK